MKVKLFTIADDSTEVWIDAFINDNRIDGYWIIPAYYDEEVELVVNSDEMNILINGHLLTIKIEYKLIEYLKIRLG